MIEFVRRLKADGLDLVDVSMGFTTNEANDPLGAGPSWRRSPGAVRARGRHPTRRRAGNHEPAQAEPSSAAGRPISWRWAARCWKTRTGPTRAARELGVENAAWTLPAPYAHWLERYRPA